MAHDAQERAAREGLAHGVGGLSVATESPFGPWLDVVVSLRVERAETVCTTLIDAAHDLNCAAQLCGDTERRSEIMRRANDLRDIGRTISGRLNARQNLERARAENAAKAKGA